MHTMSHAKMPEIPWEWQSKPGPYRYDSLVWLEQRLKAPALLRELASFLENELAEDRWDFADIMAFYNAEHSIVRDLVSQPNLAALALGLDPANIGCGARGCALGWASALPSSTTNEVKLVVRGLNGAVSAVFAGRQTSDSSIFAAMAYYGLSRAEADVTFFRDIVSPHTGHGWPVVTAAKNLGLEELDYGDPVSRERITARLRSVAGHLEAFHEFDFTTRREP